MNSVLSIRVCEDDLIIEESVLNIMGIQYIFNGKKPGDSKRMVEFYIPVISYEFAIKAINYSAMSIYNKSSKKYFRVNLKPHPDVQNSDKDAGAELQG